MTPKNLKDCIKKNKLKKIKTFITMYLGGSPENAYEFFKIKKKLKCYLIEDSCHAFGSKYFYNKKLVPVGSCKHSDISTFSLHPVKSITTGEGGIVTTNNKKFYEFVSLMRSHGLVKKKNKHWEYDLKHCGLNYRLSDINSALVSLKLMYKKEQDWFATKKGETHGAIQKEGQYGKFIVWPEQILDELELV